MFGASGSLASASIATNRVDLFGAGYICNLHSEGKLVLHTVIETFSFVSATKDAGMTDVERHELVVFLSKNPEAGDLIQGTGGARKVRVPFKGKGKSGGARVITYYGGDDIPLFLLDVYSKGDKINLSQAERNEMRKILGDLADSYRASLAEKTRMIGSGA